MIKNIINKIKSKFGNMYMVEVTHYGSRGKVYFYVKIKRFDKLMDAVQLIHKEWWKKVPDSVLSPTPVISQVRYYKIGLHQSMKIKSYADKVKMLADTEPFIWYC